MATPFETAGLQLFIDGEPITDAIDNLKTDEEKFDVYKEMEIGSVNLKKGEHVLKLLITGQYLNVDWIQFVDPNNPTSIGVARNVQLAPQTASYNVFSATGKFLGRVESGANMAATLKNAGFASGMYIMRAIGLNKTHRVQVR